MLRLLMRSGRWLMVPMAGCILLSLVSCDRETPVQTPRVAEPSFVMWGLGWCPECTRRQPTEIENSVLWDALYYNIDEQCVDQALGFGAYWFIEESLLMGRLGVDEDVINEPDWNYATGYWVPFTLRYQYGWNALLVAEQVITPGQRREAAKTLVHEAGHEFGFDEDDESLLVSIEILCTHN